MTVSVRPARIDDAQQLLDIYKPYVLETAVSFEITPPTREEFEQNIRATQEASYPYLVAECDGVPVGYAYAHRFRVREAYDHCAEVSIYLAQPMRGRGIGRALYEQLEKLLAEQGIVNLYACVAYCDEEDGYLTHASCHFHEKLGYVPVGRFSKCGHKFGRYYDLIYMEKHVGAHEELKEGSAPNVRH
ncbi:GNAT family N-acetyltransferase [Adlercreutzia sp. ZJ242]|uniref:GNAT family N-acetyltransferase n=1 Tax=Adlercreutzia sp. ZJ242 TaxID=2709409 RepID=UPI0013ECF73F|nr:GNAT family N-acetyltransferase [Adlercreutzia sp. ZJ242]